MNRHAGWLVDMSAIRPHEPTFAAVLVPRISAGLVSVCLVTELEVGYAARSVADFALLVAAVAEIEGLTVLHHDGDFDLIAEITGQPTELIAPPPGG